jgi:hypothetical protein
MVLVRGSIVGASFTEDTTRERVVLVLVDVASVMENVKVTRPVASVAGVYCRVDNWVLMEVSAPVKEVIGEEDPGVERNPEDTVKDKDRVPPASSASVYESRPCRDSTVSSSISVGRLAVRTGAFASVLMVRVRESVTVTGEVREPDTS